MISVSPEALERLKQMSGQRDDSLVMRLFVRALEGQMRYGLGWGEPEESDIVLDGDGISIHVEEFSAPFLTGAQIHFVDDGQRQGFSIRVPRSEGGGCACGRGSCGCGAR